MNAHAFLSARGLAYAYPDGPRALAGVDLELRAREFVAVIGPNGSGKSTLVKLLAGLLSPERGEVLCDGRALAAWTPAERARRIALVPQFLPQTPEVPAIDFVEGGRYAHRRRGLAPAVFGRALGAVDRAAAREALAACDALDLADRPLTALSGGQRQRVLVARAVAQEAVVLLVDEPTNALDPAHQVQVCAHLADLCARGRSALVVTHDLNLAAQFATRLVLLDQGRVAAEGPPARVLVPAVLEPVYGPCLEYLSRAGDQAPVVVPTRRSW